MRAFALPCLIITAAVLAGCSATGDSADAGGPPRECEKREDCADGKICTLEGRCDFCSSTGQCRLKELCSPETLVCALRPGWGNDCAKNEDCAAGQWCRQGLCVDRAQVTLCPSGSSDECPQGERCNSINGVCEEDLGCLENADCGAEEVCNTGTHACVPRCTPETQAQVCAGAEKCVNERCAQCAADNECGPGLVCDAAGRCSSGARCYQDRDCLVPLVCYVQTGTCVEKLPPCQSDEGCGKDQRCLIATGRCVPKSCQPDRYEPNNDAPTAFGVSASRYDALTLCNGDVDFYSLSLARGDQLGVNIDGDPFSEETFTTTVQDGTGRVLASGKQLVSYVASASATYYVSVSTSDAYQVYDVSFLLSRGIPCDDDGYEPNDQPAQATQVNSASQLEGMICPQDQDHFRVNVPAGKGLTVKLTHYTAGEGLLRLCVFDGATQLGCSDDLAPQISVPSATAAGKPLVVRVLGADDRVANRYTLEVELP